MVLVLVEPRAASFTELDIFRCFACGNVHSTEKKASPYDQGYGHSRMREFILGGATRTLLERMTVPTLMSH